MSYNPDSKTTVKHLKNLAVRLSAELDPVKDRVNALEDAAPKKVSDLENDAKYQTDTDVAAAVAKLDHLTRKKVESLEDIDPAAEGAERFIYMVPKTKNNKNGDKYDEYMVIDGEIEAVGDWAVDLSGYQATEEGKGLSANDYTDEDKDKLGGIADGATKVEASETDGAIKINGVDIQVVDIATDDEVAEMLSEVFGTSADA